jgi:hypothetical protein
MIKLRCYSYDGLTQACQTGGPQVSNLIIKLLETDFRTGKSWDHFQTAACLQFFLALNVILRPAHGFEFDMPGLTFHLSIYPVQKNLQVLEFSVRIISWNKVQFVLPSRDVLPHMRSCNDKCLSNNLDTNRIVTSHIGDWL